MSFGALKTLKLERTLGDAVLSVTKHVPTDADEAQAFSEIDQSIISAAKALIDFTPSEVKKAEVVTSGYPAIDTTPDEPKETKPKKRGRPTGSKAKTKKVEDVPPVIEPKKDEVKPIEKTVSQDDKAELVKSLQTTFESEIGFENEDTYMDEFNTFMTSLISMDYKTFLESPITTTQLKTFKALI